jgi:hypothetical protein
MKRNRKFHYDEQEGVFIFDDEISINWLLSQVLQIPGLQITKVSIDDIRKFLDKLANSDLRMPNGQHALYWLKQQVKEKMQLSEPKLGLAWHEITLKYRFIIEQVDQFLVGKTYKEFEEPEKTVLIKREPNNIEAHFEPL